MAKCNYGMDHGKMPKGKGDKGGYGDDTKKFPLKKGKGDPGGAGAGFNKNYPGPAQIAANKALSDWASAPGVAGPFKQATGAKAIAAQDYADKQQASRDYGNKLLKDSAAASAKASKAPKTGKGDPSGIMSKSAAAKKAASGADMGKPGKNFGKIAAKAGKEYGSAEAGKKVAGAIFQKERKAGKL